MVKVPALAAPQLAPCASSARAWRIWAARHSQGEAPPTGRQANPSGSHASRLQSRRFHRLRGAGGRRASDLRHQPVRVSLRLRL